jgi:hypothetical protein
MGKSHFLAIDGAVKGLCCLLTDPAAGDKTLEDGGHLKRSHAGLKDQKRAAGNQKQN